MQVQRFLDWLGPKVFGAIIVFLALIVSVTYLIGKGKIPIRELALEGLGVRAFFSGGVAEKWKPLLAKVVREADSAWLEDVGVFLLVNKDNNIDGRLGRNLGEICQAVRYAREPSRQDGNECPPEDFALVRQAITALGDVGFRHDILYVNSKATSYALNALGQKAFEQVRDDWLGKGAEFRQRIGRYDIQYPGLKDRLIKSREWYEGAIR